MAEAAKRVEQLGFDLVDLNLGVRQKSGEVQMAVPACCGTCPSSAGFSKVYALPLPFLSQ